MIYLLFSHEHKGLSIMLHLNMSPFQIHFCPSMDYIPIAFANGKEICFLIYWFICHMKKATFAGKMRNSGFNTIFSHTEYFFLHFLGTPIVIHSSKGYMIQFKPVSLFFRSVKTFSNL